MDEMRHKAVERIWLVPDASEGELGYVWCDDPAPGTGMNPEDAVEYVRKDVHDARIAEIVQERDELAAHVDRLQSALNNQLNDCINFDNGQLTKNIQENSTRVIEQTSSTSLNRRDMTKQAEILDKILLESKGYVTICRGTIVNKALELRQQAKELSGD